MTTNDEETGVPLASASGTMIQEEDNEGEQGPYVVMDMDLNGGDDDDDIPLQKPIRKMTSTSDATSATGFMSDDGMPDQDEKVKPSLDSLHEDDCGSEGEAGDNTIESCCWIWFKRILLFWVVFAILGFAVVMIGARVERDGYETADGTSHLYQLPQVCGVEDPFADEMGTTYGSAQEAHDNGALVAHCGPCGSCSSAHDMAIMSETADSLTRVSTRCAFKIFLGRRSVEKCMEERVGFTPACEDCWLDNISCSFKSCKFTCIKHKLFRKDNNKDGDTGELNDCLKCDERMCGPGFIQCSGSNRRRMGIISDIGRSDGDQCTQVDVNWFSIFDQ